MLILTRGKNQPIRIGDDISFKVLDVRRGQVRLGFEAPRNVVIDRLEVAESKRTGGKPRPRPRQR